MSERFNPTVFSAMQTGKPYKSYRKTILGKVYVTILNPFNNEPEGVILEGEPTRSPTAIIDMWSEVDDLFFRRMNKNHFETGVIIPFERPDVVEDTHIIEQAGDSELRTIINSKFLSLQSSLNQIKTEAVLYRMIMLATEMEKSEKIITAIKARLAEIQAGDVKE